MATVVHDGAEAETVATHTKEEPTVVLTGGEQDVAGDGQGEWQGKVQEEVEEPSVDMSGTTYGAQAALERTAQPVSSASAPSSVPSTSAQPPPPSFTVGEQVEVFSVSKNQWFPGVVRALISHAKHGEQVPSATFDCLLHAKACVHNLISLAGERGVRPPYQGQQRGQPRHQAERCCRELVSQWRWPNPSA